MAGSGASVKGWLPSRKAQRRPILSENNGEPLYARTPRKWHLAGRVASGQMGAVPVARTGFAGNRGLSPGVRKLRNRRDNGDSPLCPPQPQG